MTDQIAERNEELAELLGWQMYGFGFILPDKQTYVTDFHLNLDDMKQVWKVLWAQGKWMEFCEVWTDSDAERKRLVYGWSGGEWTYHFLNDLPGQVLVRGSARHRGRGLS